MILITGDIHGNANRIHNVVTWIGLGEDDTIVLLGDVGMNYMGKDRGDNYRKSLLAGLGVTLFCIHGNHEMRPETIASYHENEWHGGTVYVEDEFPNLLFAKDGEVYELNGKKAIVIGGAYSVDKWYRLERGMKWFEDEQPSDEIKARVEENLAKLEWKIDMVLSHTCPEKYIPHEAFISGIDQSTVDNSTERWLDSIEERLDYDVWYCGHWHINKRIDRMRFLMEGYEEL